MHEFKGRDLKSGSGRKVTDRKPAVAIAMPESGQSRPDRQDEKSTPARNTAKR